MHAGIATRVDRRQLLQQLRLFAQLRLNRRHLFWRKSLVKVGLEIGLGYSRHVKFKVPSSKFKVKDACPQL